MHKHAMNYLKSLFFIAFLFCQATFAFYQPTPQDLVDLNKLKVQLTELTLNNNEDIRTYYSQIKILKNNYSFNWRLNYLLTELNSHLQTILQTKKQEEKILSKQTKQAFLQKYSGNIVWDVELSENCIGWYNTLDDIAFAHDFSTALLIATRYRESNCGYYLPHNLWGPFQITSKNYWSGEISEEVFFESVVDFIKFSQEKHNRYKNRNQEEKLLVNISYKTLSMTGIVRHGALYNGLSGYTVYWNALPLNPNYVFDNYTNDYSGASRNGLITQYLKVLEWELAEKY